MSPFSRQYDMEDPIITPINTETSTLQMAYLLAIPFLLGAFSCFFNCFHSMKLDDELAALGRIAIAIKSYSCRLVDYKDGASIESLYDYLKRHLSRQDCILLQGLLVENKTKTIR
jgi:hypothetical protein